MSNLTLPNHDRQQLAPPTKPQPTAVCATATRPYAWPTAGGAIPLSPKTGVSPHGPAGGGVGRAPWTAAARATSLSRPQGRAVSVRTLRVVCPNHGVRPSRPPAPSLQGDPVHYAGARQDLETPPTASRHSPTHPSPQAGPKGPQLGCSGRRAARGRPAPRPPRAARRRTPPRRPNRGEGRLRRPPAAGRARQRQHGQPRCWDGAPPRDSRAAGRQGPSGRACAGQSRAHGGGAGWPATRRAPRACKCGRTR
jgi:hypothetical protein